MATHGSKLKVETRELKLERTLDVDGNPASVTIRRVGLSRLARIFGAAPAFVEAMGKATKEAPENMTRAEALARMERTAEFYEVAEQVAIAACIAPNFYKRDPATSDDAPPTDADVADVDSLDDFDKAAIMQATLELSKYFTATGEAKEVATFPDDGSGRAAGGPDGAPVPASDPSA